MSDLGRRRAAARRETQEACATMMAERTFEWCRARLLHALAGAARQGVLLEVLEELLVDAAGPLEDANEIFERMAHQMRVTGWLHDDEVPP